MYENHIQVSVEISTWPADLRHFPRRRVSTKLIPSPFVFHLLPETSCWLTHLENGQHAARFTGSDRSLHLGAMTVPAS